MRYISCQADVNQFPEKDGIFVDKGKEKDNG